MELFVGLEPAALAEVASRARVRRLAKDIAVFDQGAPAGFCHALTEGRIRIAQTDGNGAQVLVRFIGPGEMFGTVPLFTDGRYPAEARTLVESVELTWTRAALLELIERHPRIALNIIAILAGRIREVQDRLREVATQRVESRIANVLLRLADRAGRQEADGTAIGFPLARKDVAEMCGTTLHTVSRVLAAWEKAELVASGRRRIVLRRPAAIRRIARESAEA